MTESPLSRDPVGQTLPPGDDPEYARAEAERRRLRRWFWALGALALLGIFGLLNYKYPVAAAANGRTYMIIFQGRYVGTDGSWTEMRYFTEHQSADSIAEEAQALLPLVTVLADQHADHTIRISAVRQIFRYGLFSINKSIHVEFEKDGGEWRPLS